MDLIINFTPTGMIPTKEMTPHVPVSVNEIVEDVHRAVELGITMVHLHARDPETGKPTCEIDIYGQITEGIRKFDRELILCGRRGHCVGASPPGVCSQARRATLRSMGRAQPSETSEAVTRWICANPRSSSQALTSGTRWRWA